MEPVSALSQTLPRAQTKATDYFVDYIFGFGRDLPEPREIVDVNGPNKFRTCSRRFRGNSATLGSGGSLYAMVGRNPRSKNDFNSS